MAYFVADFNLLSLKIYIYTVVMSYFYIDIILKQNKFTILSQFLVKNKKWFLVLLRE